MYTTQRFETTVPVRQYLADYVDIPTFLEACKACPNYGQVWSCPPYDFDVVSYWSRYETLYLLATKILFQEEYLTRTYTKEELDALLDAVLPVEKQKLRDELSKKEELYPGSVSLSGGSCQICRGGCTRPQGLPCRFPGEMRYSVESLGGNVGLSISKLMGLHLEWMEEGRLPHHFILVNGLLIP